jgi:Putative amidoligase enzyme
MTKKSHQKVYPKLTDAPFPRVNTTRLVGIEVELDAGSGVVHIPNEPAPGWEHKHDGSLRNGKEVVMSEPLTLAETRARVDAFAQTYGKCHVCKTGSIHVHVSADEFDSDRAYRLASVYLKFKDAIKNLIAPSRAENKFAAVFTPQEMQDAQALAAAFSLHHAVTTRALAKQSRLYRAINFAMLRCARPAHRSVEFRAGSASTKAQVIYGWACFTAVLTDIAVNDELYARALMSDGSFTALARLVRAYERATGSQDMVRWMVWRKTYLAHTPNAREIIRCRASIRNVRGAHGMLFLSRRFKKNHAVTQRIITELVNKRFLVPHEEPNRVNNTPLKWKVSYVARAEDEFQHVFETALACDAVVNHEVLRD